MSTTTLRIDDALRERIIRLAQASDQTPHNFMLEALAQKADEAEWKLSMQRDAQQRDASLQAGEPGIEWHEMRTYLRTRLDEATDVPRNSNPAPQ
jgi:predicted transcriptional regulator